MNKECKPLAERIPLAVKGSNQLLGRAQKLTAAVSKAIASEDKGSRCTCATGPSVDQFHIGGGAAGGASPRDQRFRATRPVGPGGVAPRIASTRLRSWRG